MLFFSIFEKFDSSNMGVSPGTEQRKLVYAVHILTVIMKHHVAPHCMTSKGSGNKINEIMGCFTPLTNKILRYYFGLVQGKTKYLNTITELQ